MKKIERKSSSVSRLSPNFCLHVNFYKDGTLLKEEKDHHISYIATNTSEQDLYDPQEFISSCPQFDWENDISPLLLTVGVSLISLVITITHEKLVQQFTLNHKIVYNQIELSKVDFSCSIIIGGKLLTINKATGFSKLISKSEVLDTINRELSRLHSQYLTHKFTELLKIDPSQYEIILPAGIGGIFIHEGIGHCLEADHYFQNENIIHGRLGKRLTTNTEVSISDSCEPGLPVSYLLADDGSDAKNVNLVHNGYIENLMTDELFSKNYSLVNTGNARAADCVSMPLIRMRNTYLHNGSAEPNEIIASTKKGIFATEINGGNVYINTGNFVFNIGAGLLITDGNITGVVEPFLFSGNILNSLDSINAIGNDLSFEHAICGKGGQLINVSYGLPTIRLSGKRG